MTEAKGSIYPADWIAVARKDWHRMTVLLEDGDPDGAAFFLQQSLEKYLNRPSIIPLQRPCLKAL